MKALVGRNTITLNEASLVSIINEQLKYNCNQVAVAVAPKTDSGVTVFVVTIEDKPEPPKP